MSDVVVSSRRRDDGLGYDIGMLAHEQLRGGHFWMASGANFSGHKHALRLTVFICRCMTHCI